MILQIWQNEWSPCSLFRARPPFPFVVWTGSFLVDQCFLFLSTRVWYNSYFLISSSHLSPLNLWFPKINWWYFLLPLSWKTPIFALLFVCFRANKTSLLASKTSSNTRNKILRSGYYLGKNQRGILRVSCPTALSDIWLSRISNCLVSLLWFA